jgi:hypothetical protein
VNSICTESYKEDENTINDHAYSFKLFCITSNYLTSVASYIMDSCYVNIAWELFEGLFFQNPEKCRGLAIKFWEGLFYTSRREGLTYSFGILAYVIGLSE